MSSINLNVVGAETFGARLPTVFLEKITLEPSTGAHSTYENSAVIRAHMSLKFTKPAHMQFQSTDEFIKKYMYDLVLYSYITTDDESYSIALENGNLSLLEWHNYVESLDDAGIVSTISWYFNLRHILDSGAGTLELANSYDGEGNEIIQISNIVATFEYKGWDDPFTTSPYFEEINKVEKPNVTVVAYALLIQQQKLATRLMEPSFKIAMKKVGA